MTRRNTETLLRALFGAWGAGLIVLSYTAVAICDSCGGGGDEAFRWLGVAGGALAIVVAFSRRATFGLQWGLLAIQVGLVIAAYKSAGAGAGSVRISPVLTVVGAAFETTGVGAVSLVASENRSAT